MARRALRSWFARASYATGLTQAVTDFGTAWTLQGSPLPRRRAQDSFLVLVYHRVNDDALPLSIDTVDTHSFRAQLTYLSRKFSVCDLEDVLTRFETGRPLPPRCISITFDDGYRDNYVHAFPMLRELGLPATIFLTAGNIDASEPLWFDRVLSAFRRTRRSSIEVPGRPARPLGTHEERWRAALEVLMELKNVDVNSRPGRIAELQDRLEVDPGAEDSSLLTWAEVQTMARQGISFGSHTMTHHVLSQVDEERARWELVESRRLIESKLARPVRLFAYPHGKAEDLCAGSSTRVREAGYGLACTTIPGLNRVGDDRYRLRRIAPWPADLPSFALTLAMAVFDDTGNGRLPSHTVAGAGEAS